MKAAHTGLTRKLLPIVLVLMAGFAINKWYGPVTGSAPQAGPRPANLAPTPNALETAPGSGVSRGSGTVTRILPDDNEGSRHQRFILRLASGQTVLIAHNIDLAERVDNLTVGDTVEFQGEYVANPQGGVVHWTHRDPQGRHADGWLKHRGREYH